MSHCCPVRSILIFSLFACRVLSAPTDVQNKMGIHVDVKNGTDGINSEESDIADFDKILNDTIYSTPSNTSNVFLNLAYKQFGVHEFFAERSRQKRMPPEFMIPEEYSEKTNQSSLEAYDMENSYAHPSDDDDKYESELPGTKNSTFNSTYNETGSSNANLPSIMLSVPTPSPDNGTTIFGSICNKEILKKFKHLKNKKCFTSTPSVDEQELSIGVAMTKNENNTSADTAEETSKALRTGNNRNELDNQSSEQLYTESSDVSDSTTDSTIKSTEFTQVMQVQSSTTERTEDDYTNESNQSITKAEIKKENEAEETGMPSGIIALITAITFAVVIVIAYVGLIVWRRYLEYRYGNRELLVNDLEFDTNDLRHFEL